MAKKNNPFAALMTIAQDQQGYFTTMQAIEAGNADNTHPYHVRAGNWERVWRGIYRMTHLPLPERWVTKAKLCIALMLKKPHNSSLTGGI